MEKDILDKIYFGDKIIIRQRHHMMIKWSTLKKEIPILNVHASDNIAEKHVKQKLMK